MFKFKYIILLLTIIINCQLYAHPATTIKTIGDIGQIALPVAALFTTVMYKDKPGAVQLFKAFASTIAVGYGLKYTVNRRRPNGGYHSFPSTHTASAFAGAAFLQRRYGWSYGIPAYFAAGFVGASRVISKWHWSSDVLAGAALGIGANYIFTKPYKHFSLVPAIGNRSVGVALSWH